MRLFDRISLMRKILIVFLTPALSFLFWQPPKILTAQSPAAIDSPKIVRIYYSSKTQLSQLDRLGFDLFEGGMTQSYIKALVSPGQYLDLKQRGFRVEIDPDQSEVEIAALPSCYTNYDQLLPKLQQLNQSYPNLTEIVDVGDSWEKSRGGANRDLWVLRLTNKNIAGTKPKLFLVGEHHAREIATVEILLKFAEYLLTNYASDSNIRSWIDNREVWLLPMQNPDGHIKVEGGENWRKNTDNGNGCLGGAPPDSYGTDPNRNYSKAWGGASTNPCTATYQGPGAFSEPETQTVRDLVLRERFNLLISYHSYSELILYPWGYTNDPAPDRDKLRAIAQKFSELTKLSLTDSAYRFGQPGELLYLSTGTTDDWSYDALRIPSFTFEVGGSFAPSCSSLETIWQRNLKPMLYALQIVNDPWGVLPTPILTPTGTLTPTLTLPVPSPTSLPTTTPTVSPTGSISPTFSPSPTLISPTPAPVNADLNGDGKVNQDDLSILFASWGVPPPTAAPRADLNNDGLINGMDAAIILANWRN